MYHRACSNDSTIDRGAQNEVLVGLVQSEITASKIHGRIKRSRCSVYREMVEEGGQTLLFLADVELAGLDDGEHEDFRGGRVRQIICRCRR